jgi:hypothetical protein
MLYFFIVKNGTKTKILEWLRNWKNYKITESPAEYREVLYEFKRKDYDMDNELSSLNTKLCRP